MIKSLWASIQGNPRVMMKIHGWLTVLWFVMMPIALLTGWLESVIFISVVSIYANFTGHFSSWQASRVEVRQEEIEHKRQKENGADLDKVERKVDEIHSEVRP